MSSKPQQKDGLKVALANSLVTEAKKLFAFHSHQL